MAGLKRTSTGFGGGAPRKKARKASAITSYTKPRGIRSKQILATKVRSTMRYSDSLKFNTAHGVSDLTSFHVFRCNGPFDPDGSLGGHQPRGYDQLTSLYDEVRVIQATIEVRFTNQNGAQVYPWISLRPSSVEVPGWIDVLEGPDRIVGKEVLTKGSEGLNSTMLTMSVKPQQWLGYGPGANADDVKSNVNLVPNDQCFFYVGIAEAIDTTPYDCHATITITYDCEFSQPKSPGSS